jgi:hypothetical protein
MYLLIFIIKNILSKTKIQMPPRLWKLVICQVIGWMAYFATHLYYTDFVATVNIEYFLEIILIFSFTFKDDI